MKLADSDLDSYGFLQTDTGCTYEMEGVRTWVPKGRAVIQVRDNNLDSYVTVQAIQHVAGQNEVLFLLEDDDTVMSFSRETEVEVRVCHYMTF